MPYHIINVELKVLRQGSVFGNYSGVTDVIGGIYSL